MIMMYDLSSSMMATTAVVTVHVMLVFDSLMLSALHYWGNGSIRLQSPPLLMKMIKV